MKALCAVQIGLGILRPDLGPNGLHLTVPDANGTYTIPFIWTWRACGGWRSFGTRRL